MKGGRLNHIHMTMHAQARAAVSSVHGIPRSHVLRQNPYYQYRGPKDKRVIRYASGAVFDHGLRLKPGSLESRIISHPRYDVLGHVDGGVWGAVYKVHDKVSGQDVGVKILRPSRIARDQMRQRGLSFYDAVRKEVSELFACSNVVPRKLEVDCYGKGFIVMPLYERFFHDIIREDGEGRLHNGAGLSLEDVLSYAYSISGGLGQMHRKLRRAHGDLKPANIAVDEDGDLLLTDLGTSTVLYGLLDVPRDNMGHLLTRSPECFRTGSRPTCQSDVFGFGSLMYRLFCGRYIFEDELILADDVQGYLARFCKDGFDDMVRSRVEENVPAEFCDLLIRSMRYEPGERYPDGQALLDAVIPLKYGLHSKSACYGN